MRKTPLNFLVTVSSIYACHLTYSYMAEMYIKRRVKNAYGISSVCSLLEGLVSVIVGLITMALRHYYNRRKSILSNKADEQSRNVAVVEGLTSSLSMASLSNGIPPTRISSSAPAHPCLTSKQLAVKAKADRLLLYACVLLGLSRLFTNASLKYISYPLATLFKSSKALGVMLVALATGHRSKVTPVRAVTVMLIMLGSVMYSLGEQDKVSRGSSSSLYGVTFLLLTELCNAFSAHLQDIAIDSVQAFSPVQTETMQIYNGLCSMLCCFVLVMLTSGPEIFASISPALYRGMLLCALLQSIGIVPVLLCVKTYGNLVTAIVTTIRKLLAVIVSVLFVGHVISAISWLGIAIAFLGVILSVFERQLRALCAHRSVRSSKKAE